MTATTLEYDEIIEGLRLMSGWSSFAASLLKQHRETGVLSHRQWDAAERSILKSQERNAKRPERVEVDFSRIETLLYTARANGLKRPVFRACGMSFSLAPSTGANAGAVYVKADGEYAGKLMAGRFYPIANTPAWVPLRLIDVAENPRGKAIDYGRETGVCACCGRTLTDPKSIALGIGPICLDQWGL